MLEIIYYLFSGLKRMLSSYFRKTGKAKSCHPGHNISKKCLETENLLDVENL